MTTSADLFLASIGAALDHTGQVSFTGNESLPSVYAATDLAAASIGAASLVVARLMDGTPTVEIDRRLASLWFGWSFKADGWEPPPVWDPVAGDYRAADGWIRLHTNAPRHRQAALSVLDVPAERDAVAAAVLRWNKDELEARIVEAGGCAAAMRPSADWLTHPQGAAVSAEPLIARASHDAPPKAWRPHPGRPLAGIRVLDLTRVLAGPVATRFLAGYGAEILRIDPLDWDEGAVIPEVTLGKSCARLDLHKAKDRARFESLLAGADMLVHGYRADALESLGYGEAARRGLNPTLIDVSLNAYGWTGPWRGRRGFDSLVQMSAGIAATGMTEFQRDRPTPLPVQALDHATGYLMAAAAVDALTRRQRGDGATTARLSLARTACLLAEGGVKEHGAAFAASYVDWQDDSEMTDWGPARRLRPPARIEGAPLRWDRPASRLGSAEANWR